MALGWLWVALRGPYFCFLLSTFCSCQNVALGGLQPFSFKVEGSRYDVRRSACGRKPKHRKAACRPSAVNLAYIARPGRGWSGPKLSPEVSDMGKTDWERRMIRQRRSIECLPPIRKYHPWH